MKTLTNRKPEIIVFAGPNGSGKSTFTKKLLPADFLYVNADDIKKSLHCTDLEAAQEAERLRESYLACRYDFSFETVLSTERNLHLLSRAKSANYFIRCYYVLTSDPLINVYRVNSRVKLGGHDVPTDKIISRYYKSLALVKNLVPLCDVCHIYDNSEKQAFRIFKKRKNLCFYDECEDWKKQDISFLTCIASMTKINLNH